MRYWTAYKAGWIGLKSTPHTDTSGWSSASPSQCCSSHLSTSCAPKSMDQMPVPHPASRTRRIGLSFPAGDTKSWLSSVSMQMLC